MGKQSDAESPSVPVSRFRPTKPAMTEPRKIEVAIERIVPGGSGMGHAEDLTVFVPDTAPGDRVMARIDRVRGRVAFADLVEVLEASALRAAGVDPHAGRCGGCDFQHLTYEAQL